MRIGTKSVLFGAHCFFLHPWFVAWGWWKLYGFPFDPRLWVAFFVHDLGYLGKPNMDGPEGEDHPRFGAELMSMFDAGTEPAIRYLSPWRYAARAISFVFDKLIARAPNGMSWYCFSFYHSRYLCKAYGAKPSRLCFADKLSFALTPRWLYLPMVNATGEIREYLKNAQKADSGHWKPTGADQRVWHEQLCEYMRNWVEAHKAGAEDTWTDSARHAKTESGVSV